MILKLIQAGSFVGRTKTSEEDVSALPEELQVQLAGLFSGAGSKPAQARAQSASRDKENYFIEYNGKTLPVQSVQPGKDLGELIEKMKSNLQYQSGQR